jgi:RimJ/RimL family protein N-acetyltransferase
MAEVTIRPALNSDITLLSAFNHNVETDHVWQMAESGENDEINIRFQITRLPRTTRVDYPYQPSWLIERWRFFSLTLTGCISGIPVGYISVSTIQSVMQIWIKDIVVDTPWRRQGIATLLLRAVRDWGENRNYQSLMLEMSSKNIPMICLSRELDFTFSGFNDHYYHNGDIALFFVKSTKQVF